LKKGELVMEKGFREMLTERQKNANSLVCVGLDPLPEKLPKKFAVVSDRWVKISTWMKDIVDATAPYTSMYKPQRAHYEAIEHGTQALKDIIDHIHTNHPGIPVFLDCKRGDIDRTQQRYGVAHFEIDGADGMNFSPYMGKSCMEALVDDSSKGKALVGLCYTSNPPAREVQDVKSEDGRLYWEFIAERTLKWAEELGVVKDAGLVMAAAYEHPKGSGKVYSEHLKRCREIVGNKMWFLIPGIGTQEGFVEETIRASYKGPGSIAINSSSAIIFASDGDDYAEAAAKKAKELRDQIRAAI
jgi:orotidine-5'-phosphate decarboxylase